MSTTHSDTIVWEPGNVARGLAAGVLPNILLKAIPLTIAKFLRRGGPTTGHVKRAECFVELLNAFGDRVIFRHTPQKTIKMFKLLAMHVAALSFRPDGVRWGELHYRADGHAQPNPPYKRKRRSKV